MNTTSIREGIELAIINNSEVAIVVLVVEFGDIFGVWPVAYFCDGGVSPVVVFGIELAADAACYVVYDVVGVVIKDVVVDNFMTTS